MIFIDKKRFEYMSELKPLPTGKKGIQIKASNKKMISYSFVFFTFSMFGYGNIYALYEINVFGAAGLSVADAGFLVALVMGLFTIWNMINDPLCGWLTDRPMRWTKKWGMRFPWILIGIFPTIFFWFLLWVPPEANAADPWPIFLYLLIILCLFDFFFSIYSTQALGAYPVHFRSEEDRRKAGVLVMAFGGIAVFSFAIINSLTLNINDKSTFATAAIIIVIVQLIGVVLFIPGVRETEEITNLFLWGYEHSDKISFIQALKTALTAKNFMISTIAYLLFSCSATLIGASSLYWYNYGINTPYSYLTLAAIFQLVCYIIFMPLWSKVANKIGTFKTYTLGLILTGISSVFAFLFVRDFTMEMIMQPLYGASNACFYIMIQPILSDCYDEVTVKTGRHQEASMLGVRNFFFRLAVFVSTFSIAIVHIITAYDISPGAIQSDSAIMGVRLHSTLIPALFNFIGALVFYVFYNLYGKKKEEMKQKMIEMGL